MQGKRKRQYSLHSSLETWVVSSLALSVDYLAQDSCSCGLDRTGESVKSTSPTSSSPQDFWGQILWGRKKVYYKGYIMTLVIS